jgi:hypothetical protein
MSERVEASLSPALLAQRAALQRARTSAALDARFEQSLGTWRARRVRAGRGRRLSWALAAAAAGVLVMSTAWLVMHIGTPPARAEMYGSAQAQVADADGAVLRVRASLGAQLPVRNGNGFSSRQRYYWVDVRVAPDGTLNIERVTPIDEDPQLFVP